MKYLSICSGIEAASVAWHPLGWEPIAFSEIEPFPSAVLAHHWPDVPNLGDMTKHHEWNEETQSTCGIVQDDKAPLEFQNTLRHDAGAMGDDDGKTESSLCPLLMSDGSTSSGSRSRERSSEGNIVSSVQHQIASSGGRRMDDAGACLPIRKRIKFSEIDVLVGGTPCQAFSVAGLRNSLSDERGNLTLIYVNILNQIDEARNLAGRPPAICLWENVPGVLTTKDNAFGCFLGALAGEDIPLEPPGGKWKNTGYVRGPQRTIAWRVLDAQYFGVAQRRRRVFVVASARDGFSPEQILFEFTGLRRDIAPSREAGEGTAGNAESRSHWSGGPHPTLNQSRNIGGIGMSNQELFSQQGAGLVPDTCGTITAGMSKGMRGTEGVESNWMVPEIANCLQTTCDDYSRADGFNMIPVMQFGNIAGSLTARHDSSPCADRGQNVVAFVETESMPSGNNYDIAPCMRAGKNNLAVAFTQNTRDEVRIIGGDGQITGALAASSGMKQTNYVCSVGFNGDQSEKTHSMGEQEEQAPTLRSCRPPHVAFGVAESPEVAHCLRSGASKADKHESTTYVAAPRVAFEATHEVAGTMKACKDSGGWSNSADHAAGGYMAIAPPYAVRRLTPTECERLQGFPDGHTLIPWRNKPADQCPDGPRYKALGNSMAVPVMHWIGKRIQLINDICNSKLN